VLTVKPSQLSLLTRAIEYKKRFGLSVSAMLHVPIDQESNGVLWAEQSLWNFVSSREFVPMLDEGVIKLTPEYLVSGYAYPTENKQNACATKVRLGDNEKTVLAFGDRFWEDGRSISEPQNFTKLPLVWENAFGGAGFSRNPLGKGIQAQQSVKLLPNFESLNDRLLRSNQSITPACFSAIDCTHPQRVQYRGTYDSSYLKEHSPGFPPDLDWRYFNMAPSDQWLGKPLKGNERFELHNLHPTRPLIEGNLPSFQLRLFSQFQEDVRDSVLREVPMRLTTVWFFPDAERYVLIFHGLVETNKDDGSDIQTLVGAVERLDEAKSIGHYLKVIAQRAEPELGSIHAMRDSDLLPAKISTTDPDVELAKKPFAMEGLQADAQFARAAIEVEAARLKAVSLGKNPDELGIKMPVREVPPEGDELVAYLEKQAKENELQQLHALNDTLKQLEIAMQFAEKHKIDIGDLQHRGPPNYTAKAHVAEIKASLGKNRIDDNALLAKMSLKEQAERTAYLQGAHDQAPAKPMPNEKAAGLKDELRAAIQLGIKTFIGIDLTGADLSELDLRGLDFSHAWLESVNFSNSNVSRANFSSAVMAHSDLSGAVAIEAIFFEANLGRANLKNIVFDKAELSSANLMYCNFDSTSLPNANLDKALLLETTWGKADWSGVKTAGQTFYKADMRGMIFAEADLTNANFLECDLSGVDFTGAILLNTNFMGCKLIGAKFRGANAIGATFVKGCDLSSADLSSGNFSRANFGASNLSNSQLIKGVFDQANFAEANLTEADCRLSSMKSSMLRKVSARRALLAGVNFDNAIMQHADLRGADLRNSNLFAVDMSRIRLDSDVLLDRANLKRARTWPRLSAEQQASAI
jgi:uncharacterized protein YjbI with pentapeptide repeats